MIFADKLIDLRKKSGMSQEQFAEKMNVSRQSVSKWESAQSVPDLNKIVLMSEIFNVSTDYLLKDNIEEIIPTEEKYSKPDSDGSSPVTYISLEDANNYLDTIKSYSKKTALGVVMCILSFVPLMLLSAAGDEGIGFLNSDQSDTLGAILMFFVIAAAVALFIINAEKLRKYQFLNKHIIETEYGVSGMVKEKRKDYSYQHTLKLALGVVFCIISVTPVLVTSMINENNDFMMTSGVALMLVIISAGVYMITESSIVWGAFSKLLQTDDYSIKKKLNGKKSVIASVAGIYWLVITAVYLAYSFHINDFGKGWVIFAVGGVLFGVVAIAVRLIESRKK